MKTIKVKKTAEVPIGDYCLRPEWNCGQCNFLIRGYGVDEPYCLFEPGESLEFEVGRGVRKSDKCKQAEITGE